MHHFFMSLCIFCVIILSKRSSAADYRYEACSVPVHCGGVNISFPFYIQGQQANYSCGYPGFELKCGDLIGSQPVLESHDNEYVIQGISYTDRSFRVIDSAVLNSNSSSCLPGIRNTTLYAQSQFDFVDVKHIRLFGDCPRESLTSDLSRYKVECGGWDLALYDDGGDEIRIALEDCPRNVLVPVDGAAGGGNGGIGHVLEVARKGFELSWTAADCGTCEISGGRCGFNETSHKFMCFCPDRPHTGGCKPDMVT